MRRVRHTSRLAYSAICDQLTERRQRIFRHLVSCKKPPTAREVMAALNLQTNTSGQFTVMRDTGVIAESKARECKITGRTALTWEVTGFPPTRPTKLPSDKEILRAEVERLTAENRQLRSKLRSLRNPPKQERLFGDIELRPGFGGLANK